MQFDGAGIVYSATESLENYTFVDGRMFDKADELFYRPYLRLFEDQLETLGETDTFKAAFSKMETSETEPSNAKSSCFEE